MSERAITEVNKDLTKTEIKFKNSNGIEIKSKNIEKLQNGELFNLYTGKCLGDNEKLIKDAKERQSKKGVIINYYENYKILSTEEDLKLFKQHPLFDIYLKQLERLNEEDKKEKDKIVEMMNYFNELNLVVESTANNTKYPSKWYENVEEEFNLKEKRFHCKAIRVKDGDTVVLQIYIPNNFTKECGISFEKGTKTDIYINKSVRFYGVKAHEKNDYRGELAKQLVEQKLKEVNNKVFIFVPKDIDKYGRVLATIFLKEKSGEFTNLNKLLLEYKIKDENVALPYIK